MSSETRNQARFCEKSGKLYITDGDTNLVFRRGEARCWIKPPGCSNWRPHRPEYMTNPLKGRQDDFWKNENRRTEWKRSDFGEYSAAVYQWFLTLPIGISKQLAQIHDSMFWGAISILSRVKNSEELFFDNPAWTLLAYYQDDLNGDNRSSFSFAKVRRTLEQPRKALMTSLGIDRPASAVRILKKIDPLTVYIEVLRTVVEFLRIKENPLRKYFEHCQTYTTYPFVTALEAIKEAPAGQSRIDLRYLRQLEKSGSGHQMQHDLYYADALEMERQLGIGKKPTFSSVEQMIAHHDSLIWRYLNRKGRAYREVILPPPLISSTVIHCAKGTVEITHLKSGGQVMAHAQIQKNCILSYIPSTQAGNATIYAVRSNFAPLHTLAVLKRSDGSYTFQCAKAGNQNPDFNVFDAVTDWFHASDLAANSSGKAK